MVVSALNLRVSRATYSITLGSLNLDTGGAAQLPPEGWFLWEEENKAKSNLPALLSFKSSICVSHIPEKPSSYKAGRNYTSEFYANLLKSILNSMDASKVSRGAQLPVARPQKMGQSQ